MAEHAVKGTISSLALDLAEAEAERRRASLARNLTELKVRMQPGNLMAEAEEMVWSEVDRVTDEAIELANGFASDGAEWLRNHRGPAVVGGLLVAACTAVAIWYSTRRKPVPLYAAYAMEDPDIMDDLDDLDAGKAANAWAKVKDGARELGGRAEDGYATARTKAQTLSVEARERASDAADFAVAAARDAADAAREAAAHARESAKDAGRWARRQPQENPASVLLVALAAGVLVGALLPSRNRD